MPQLIFALEGKLFLIGCRPASQAVTTQALDCSLPSPGGRSFLSTTQKRTKTVSEREMGLPWLTLRRTCGKLVRLHALKQRLSERLTLRQAHALTLTYPRRSGVPHTKGIKKVTARRPAYLGLLLGTREANSCAHTHSNSASLSA